MNKKYTYTNLLATFFVKISNSRDNLIFKNIHICLNISNNNLGGTEGTDCIEALKGLLDCPSIHTLDIQSNYMNETSIVKEIFCKMLKLAVLYSKGN